MYKFSWVKIAEGEIGQREVSGNLDNQRIVEYHSVTTLKAKADAVPWCSSFVNWVLNKSGYPITRSAAAKSWATYGQETKPVPGCIVVMKRTGGNHVGFYVSSNDKVVRVLGGNQSNAVNIKSFAKENVYAYRLPKNLSESDKEIFNNLTTLGV